MRHLALCTALFLALISQICATAILPPCPKGAIWCESTTVSKDATYLCVNTLSDLENCGGCARANLQLSLRPKIGRNCLMIPGLEGYNVRCVRSICQVDRCQAGWKISKDGTSCQEDYDEGD